MSEESRSSDRDSGHGTPVRFLQLATVVTVLTSLVALVFAGQGARIVRRTGRPGTAASVVVTAFGLWFVSAPLLYGSENVAFAPTAGVQFGGLLLASFGGYSAVQALEVLVYPRGGPSR